ncbi:DHS-like NAD/FAD-binding domain-containing protein [Linnemannia elongata AG-77]|uniref:DHS-like NAD/FAD-binding domain-containing protein n=1 Tax=Linnemannia elongata AG-77 TaxID=1314771 RepID=A0A197KAL4_9FUNG|nr:DHS-like NAD/FAD-binding domain-containing protein [Linnemannia elongata AG-77]
MKLRISLRSVSKSLSTTSDAITRIPLTTASKELASFLRDGHSNITVLTGAGVSTDSAIPDYRGENGTYTLNPDYKPVFFQAFVASEEARHRYWARSFLGFPPIMTTQPNPTHYALAALQLPTTVQGPSLDPKNKGNQELSKSGYIKNFITQNVDGLHQKAGARNVIELHGTLHSVKCMTCGHEEDRSDFQQVLADLNPEWNDLLQSQSTSRLYTRMNADGDVELNTPEQQQYHQQHSSKDKVLDYRNFQYPTCSCCGTGHYKPSVVFFGENIPPATKESSSQAILESNGLLVIGTSLATFSAFRLVQLAKDTGIPIAMINLGQSRGDTLANLRYDENSSLLLKAVSEELGLGEIPGVIKRRKQVMNVVGS